MTKNIPITVCSAGGVKVESTIAAARRVLAELGITYDVRSREVTEPGGVEQPYRDLQILTEAQRRADLVSQASGHLGRYVVAPENGVAPRGAGYSDLAYVVVRTPSGRLVVRASAEVSVPAELVYQAMDSGWTRTCGRLEADRTPGVLHYDPHSFWSRGATTRVALLTDAVEEALRAALRAEGVIS